MKRLGRALVLGVALLTAGCGAVQGRAVDPLVEARGARVGKDVDAGVDMTTSSMTFLVSCQH